CVAGEQSQCFAFHLLGEPVDGVLAELAVVPARNCYRKPAAFSFEEAAAFGLVSLTAYRMVSTRAQVRAGETVLLTGIRGCGATAGGDPPADIHRIFWNQLTVLGSTMGSARDMREALRLAEQGLLRPVVDSVFPLERAREAIARLESNEQFGKVVIKVK